MFEYTIVELDKIIVELQGDMDIEATETMEHLMVSELNGTKSIELNFKDVAFVDSSGIGLLITLVTNLKQNGVLVVITNLQEDVKLIFDLLQLNEILGSDVFGE